MFARKVVKLVWVQRRLFGSFQQISERRDRLISRFKALPEIRLNDREVTKSAAVLIALCEEEERKVSLLFTLRSSLLKNHKRQVSFPGGILDKGVDKCFEDCAIRETEEETGIPRSKINVWGTGSLLVPFKSIGQEQIEIMPVIGSIERFSDIQLSPCHDEVEKVFTVPLDKLVDQQLRRHTQFRSGRGYSMPVYLGGEERIWGMTAILTHLFLSVLLPKDVYSKKVPFVSLYKS